jgi:hypothetical protein
MIVLCFQGQKNIALVIRGSLRDEINYRTTAVQTHQTVWTYDNTLETYTRLDVVTAGIFHVIVFWILTAWQWFVQTFQRNALRPSSGGLNLIQVTLPLLTFKSRVLEKLYFK